MTREELLRVDGLTKDFVTEGTFTFGKGKGVNRAVDHVSFVLGRSETLGILGESGCGKTTLARTVLLLTPPTSGEVTLLGRKLTSLSESDLRGMRRHTGLVFQDPISSLNPRMKVRDIIAEPLEIHDYPKDEIGELVKNAADEVKLSERELERFPHQLSGGQRQRVGIGRAIVSRPEFVVLDEPTSSLDISVQAQILNLLLDMQADLKISFLFISHNINVVRYMSDRIGVMYVGRIIEIGAATSVMGRPMHPYTRLLIDSIPLFSKRGEFQGRTPARADIEERAGWVSECSFNKRCPYAQDRCRTEEPLLREVEEGHFVACHFAPFTE
ncbi:MAG: ABC transporter ATP-binding protein [Thaumarchaeota archaeon]|nr:ABC transporter ATP-binding protein [Nitrososphaerota archaeon]